MLVYVITSLEEHIRCRENDLSFEALLVIESTFGVFTKLGEILSSRHPRNRHQNRWRSQYEE